MIWENHCNAGFWLLNTVLKASDWKWQPQDSNVILVNLGKPDAKILDDGWTAVTRDRSLSMQFEHSMGVTATGVEIFTKSPKGLDKPPYG